MEKRFEIIFLEEAMTFLRSLEEKHYIKYFITSAKPN